jgi:hypothetical protein
MIDQRSVEELFKEFDELIGDAIVHATEARRLASDRDHGSSAIVKWVGANCALAEKNLGEASRLMHAYIDLLEEK